jgi:GntR family transcriptional regulator
VTSYRVDPRRDAPPSRQIVEAILDAVASGDLEPEAKLLSVREMAAEALVNHNTVARAYRDLEQLAVVEGHNGRGVFVTRGALAIAQGLRHAETLAAFERALDHALRSGHALDDLLERMRPRAIDRRTNGKKVKR